MLTPIINMSIGYFSLHHFADVYTKMPVFPSSSLLALFEVTKVPLSRETCRTGFHKSTR